MSLSQWTQLYQRGFSQITSLVEHVENSEPESAYTKEIMVDSLTETNQRLLREIRNEKQALEEEVKQFLARVNGKLSYLKSMENHLEEWEVHFDSLRKASTKILGGGERFEK